MKRVHLQVLASTNLRAANDMVMALAAGIFAGGTVKLHPQVVGDLALDTAEYILAEMPIGPLGDDD